MRRSGCSPRLSSGCAPAGARFAPARRALNARFAERGSRSPAKPSGALDDGTACNVIPMGSAAERVPTFEELYQAIQALPRVSRGEILEPGVIRTMGRPGGGHRNRCSRHRENRSQVMIWEGGSGCGSSKKARSDSKEPFWPCLSPGWRLAEDNRFLPFHLYQPDHRAHRLGCEVLSDPRGSRPRDRCRSTGSGVEWIWLSTLRRDEWRWCEALRARRDVDTFEGSVSRAIRPILPRWWIRAVGGWDAPHPDLLLIPFPPRGVRIIRSTPARRLLAKPEALLAGVPFFGTVFALWALFGTDWVLAWY